MGEGIWPVPVHTKDVQWDLNLLDLPHKSFFLNAHAVTEKKPLEESKEFPVALDLSLRKSGGLAKPKGGVHILLVLYCTSCSFLSVVYSV